jgi:ABC-type phosphate transport system permease subunit
MGQYFKLNGLTGFFIAVALLLSILVVLTINAISVQQDQATNFYKVNQDTDALKAIDSNNKDHYTVVGNN